MAESFRGALTMKQYRVKGIDSFDKTSYLNEQGHWVSPKDAALFTRHAAEQAVVEINSRNMYLDREDRVTASVVGAM